jgi:hypothetical protein
MSQLEELTRLHEKLRKATNHNPSETCLLLSSEAKVLEDMLSEILKPSEPAAEEEKKPDAKD